MFCWKKALWAAPNTCAWPSAPGLTREGFSRERSWNRISQRQRNCVATFSVGSCSPVARAERRRRGLAVLVCLAIAMWSSWSGSLSEGERRFLLLSEQESWFGKRGAHFWWTRDLRPCTVPTHSQFWWMQQGVTLGLLYMSNEVPVPTQREAWGSCEADALTNTQY